MPYADPIRTRETTAAWNRNHPDARKRHQRQYGRNTKAKALQMLGGRCVVCGESDLRLLTINHKNGDGNKERQGVRLLRGGAPMYRAINSGQRSSEDLDVRCYNHNILYEYEIGRRHWNEG